MTCQHYAVALAVAVIEAILGELARRGKINQGSILGYLAAAVLLIFLFFYELLKKEKKL